MAVAEVTLTPKGKGRRKAKQDDLPSMESHQRRIAEIEEIADELVDLEDQLSAIKEKRNDAMENLVASMKRHDRSLYERQTWGRVILKESKTKASVKKQVIKPVDPDDEVDEDSPAE